jgi:membrane protein
MRFLSFAMVMGVAFLLLVSLILSTVLTVMTRSLGSGMSGQIINTVVSLIVFTFVFAAIFKVLPDAKVRWRDVWIGAAFTAALFTLGKYLIGVYLARGSVASVFGAAGSLVAVLVWIYYSAQILFIGAEFTQVYSKTFGPGIAPDEYALPVTEAARVQAGMSPRPHRLGDIDEPWYPAVPINRRMAVTSEEKPSSILSKLVPLLAGLVIGKLSSPTRRKIPNRAASTHTRISFARIIEPGWVTRNRTHTQDMTIRIPIPSAARKMAGSIGRGYAKIRSRIAQYV